MRPTQYNKRITVQKPTKTWNDIGGWSNNYSELEWSFSCWASVVPIKGFKKLEYGKLGYDQPYEVEMRKRLVNADGDCRIVYAGENYAIIALRIDDEKVYLDIGRTD
jgi:head-tail adaptor